MKNEAHFLPSPGPTARERSWNENLAPEDSHSPPLFCQFTLAGLCLPPFAGKDAEELPKVPELPKSPKLKSDLLKRHSKKEGIEEGSNKGKEAIEGRKE
jgi:hypothetical protein